MYSRVRNKRAGTFINFQTFFPGGTLLFGTVFLFNINIFDQTYPKLSLLGCDMPILAFNQGFNQVLQGARLLSLENFPGGTFILAGTFISHTRVFESLNLLQTPANISCICLCVSMFLFTKKA